MKSLLVKDKSELTKAENKICNYIEEYMNSSIYMTVTEIANNCGVGEATVTRFCRKLGFRSFLEFKMTMAQEFKNNGYEEEKFNENKTLLEEDSVGDFIKKFYEINTISLEDTIKKINYKMIEEVTDIIIHSKRIHFAGVGHSGVIAEDAYYKFMKIGLICSFYRDSHTLVMMASLMQEGDILFVISDSGNTEQINVAAEIAKENNVKVISITENLLSKLSRISDYVFNYSHEKLKFDMEYLSTRSPQTFIIDLLNTNVIRKNKDISLESKSSLEKAIQKLNK